MSRSSLSGQFDELIVSLSDAEVFGSNWERSPVFLRAVDEVSNLVTIEQVEELVYALSDPGSNWIQVVRQGKFVSQSSLLDGSGFLSLPVIYDAYMSGYTLQLAKLNRRHPAVRALCRDIECLLLNVGMALDRTIGSHLYLSPPESSGFNPHYDDHNVIVLQARGSKLWRLYDSKEAPIERESFESSREMLGEQQHEFLLNEGDVLYVPRGCYHDAVAQDSESIHITLDIYPYTLNGAISDYLTQIPAYRRAVHPAMRDKAGAGTAPPCLSGFMQSEEFEDTIQARKHSLMLDMGTLPSHGLRDLTRLNKLTSNTEVRHRPGIKPMLTVEDEVYRLHYAGSAIEGNIESLAVIEYICEHSTFQLADIPGDIDAEGRMALARRLIFEGFLEML